MTSRRPPTPIHGRPARRLHVAATGVRRSAPTTPTRDGDAGTDADLRDLLADPYTDIDETHERLRALRAAFEAREDRREVFLSVYARMTRAVADRIRDGDFADPEWVSEYLVTFANLYREAVLAYETGDFEALPTPWQLAFEAAERGDSLVVQDAALGVNAHINYDLALTLERVGVAPNRAEKYADHHLVTDVIREILDETQDALAERDAPGLATVDEALGPFDEWLWVFTIDECRDSAWRTAVALHSRVPLRRRLARWINAVTSAGAAHLLVASQRSPRLHDAVRSLEGSGGE